MSALTAGARRDIRLGMSGSYSPARDAIKHNIWDTRTFATVIADFRFFSQPQGNPWRVGVKTVNETNITQNGTLPNGQTFMMHRMGVSLIIPLQATDTNGAIVAQAFTNLMQSSVFEVGIEGRLYDYQTHGTSFLAKPIQVSTISASSVNHQRVGDVIGSGWVNFHPAPIFIDQLVGFFVQHRLGNPDTNVVTILNANSSLLYGLYGTMQIMIEGFLTRAK